MNAHPINLVHFYRMVAGEFVAPCGATEGNRSLSSSWDVVDCPDCLRTHPVPIVKAYCRPESAEPVYECGVCGEFHTQAAWAEYMNQRYDGAPSETDTTGYGSTDRAALRDAGRRVR